ncbi:hypothetical protein ACI78V_09965 [Geodermatophilus sp. SYSU D00742]
MRGTADDFPLPAALLTGELTAEELPSDGRWHGRSPVRMCLVARVNEGTSKAGSGARAL